MTTAAVLFDFDGTLVESLDVKIAAFSSLYAPYGKAVEQAAVEHYRAHTGVSRIERIRHCHQHILGEEPSEATVNQLSDAFGAVVEDKVVHCPWVTGAREFLDAHHGTLSLFIASATPQQELQRIVNRRGMGHFFTAVFGSPPDKTTVIREIVATHQFEPAEVVMVGDGRADYDAAVATGVRFVGRTPPNHPDPFPQGAVVIADLSALGDHI